MSNKFTTSKRSATHFAALFISRRLFAVIGLAAFSFALTAFTNAPTRTDNQEEWLRSDIISYSKQYVGIRYRSAGRSPQTGFDCSGFTAFIMKVFNIQLANNSGGQASQGQRINPSEARKGDILVFGYRGRVSHVGLVASNDDDGLTMIHCGTSSGVVVENIQRSTYWRGRLMYAVNIISTSGMVPADY